MVTDRTCDLVIVSNSVRHVIERDGRNLLKKSLYAQKPTFTYAISRLCAKDVPSTRKSLRAHKSLTGKSRTFTYALSRLRAKTYYVRTKSPRAHKSYTYAISHLRAQVVLYVRTKSLYAQKSYILRPVSDFA